MASNSIFSSVHCTICVLMMIKGLSCYHTYRIWPIKRPGGLENEKGKWRRLYRMSVMYRGNLGHSLCSLWMCNKASLVPRPKYSPFWWYFSIRHGYKFRTDTFCVSLTICLKYTIAVTNQLLFIFINLSFTVKTLTYLCTYMYSFSETRRDWEFRLTPLELNIVLLKGLRKICSCELWEFVKIKNRSWKLGRASRWGFSLCRL